MVLGFLLYKPKQLLFLMVVDLGQLTNGTWHRKKRLVETIAR